MLDVENNNAVRVTDLQGLLPIQYLPAMPLAALLEHTDKVYVRRGEVILAPGMELDHQLFLLSGRLVCQETGEMLDAYFRYSLQSNYQKGETLVTETDCCLIQVNAEALDKLLCWAQASRYLEIDLAQQFKTDNDSHWIHALLSSNLFLKVSPLNMSKLLERLIPVPVSAGDVVLQQGDIGDACYFIKQGKATVTRQETNQESIEKIAEISYGRCFGEDALVYEKKRNASVTMLTDGLLMKMEKRDFLELLKEPAVATISAVDLEMLLSSSVVLLDVRTLEEFEKEHLNHSLHQPLGVLRSMLPLLNLHCEYVVYCDTGRRSKMAVYFLEQLGYRARALLGGLANLTTPQRHLLVSKN